MKHYSITVRPVYSAPTPVQANSREEAETKGLELWDAEVKAPVGQWQLETGVVEVLAVPVTPNPLVK